MRSSDLFIVSYSLIVSIANPTPIRREQWLIT